MSEQPNRRSECLQTAERLVNHDRNTTYDEPSADFARIAGMWTAYLGVPIKMCDVAARASYAERPGSIPGPATNTRRGGI